jgi:uncharacterized membrane protein
MNLGQLSQLIGGPFAFSVFCALGVITALVHIIFALYVTRDARNLRCIQQETFGGGPILWFFATLIGGVFVATAYWLIHHSTLRSSAYSSMTKQ